MHCQKAFLSDALRQCLEEFDFVSLFRLFSFHHEGTRHNDGQETQYQWFLVDRFFRLFLRQVRNIISSWLHIPDEIRFIQDFRNGQEIFLVHMKTLDTFLVGSIKKFEHPSEPCRTVAQHRAQAFMGLYQLFAPNYNVPKEFKRQYRKALVDANNHHLGRCKRHVDSDPVPKRVRPESNQIS